jgi:hypothetical protein
VRLYAPLPIGNFLVESDFGSFTHPWEPEPDYNTYGFHTGNDYGVRSVYTAGDSLHFLLKDLTDTTLQYEIVHANPGFCSYVGGAEYVNVRCDDNATVADSTDDRYVIETLVHGPTNVAFQVYVSPNQIFTELHEAPLTLFGPAGSIYQDTLRVRIEQEGGVFTEHFAFPLSGEGCSEGVSSVSGFRQNQLRLYPNPVSDHFTVEGLTSGHTPRFELIDSAGKPMLVGQLNADGMVRLPAGLPAGKYVLRLENGTALELLKR